MEQPLLIRHGLLAASLAGAVLAAAAPPAGAQETAPRPLGVTVLEARELGERLEEARALLASGDGAAALARIQGVLEANPAALLRERPDDLLFVGARRAAQRLLQEQPEEVLALRERTWGARAELELRAALDPPDLGALRALRARYPSTLAAARAESALRELLLDRGLAEQAARGRALGEFLPPAWVAALPAPPVRAPQLAPSYSGLDDPRLPVVRSEGAERRWELEFRDVLPPRGFTNYRMAIGGSIGYLSDSRETMAVDLASGEVLWRNAGPEGWSDSSTDTTQLLDGFELDTLIAPVLEDGVLLVAIHEVNELGRAEEFRRIPVRRLLPGRRLWAFDAATGEVLWKQEVGWKEQDPEPHGLVAAPPAAAAGRVFVPVYDAIGTVDLSIQALDLHTGKPLWKTFLVSGQRETTNLFGNVLREPACGVPAADDERVLVCTNLGAVCALDAATGAALWTRLYERTPVRSFQTGMEGLREETFANGPPAYDGSRFVCTPTDSREALAIDADTGAVLGQWRTGSRYEDQADLRHLVAVLPWGPLFNGVSVQLRSFPLQSARQMVSARIWDKYSHYSVRHPAALASGEILVPAEQGIVSLDPDNGRPRGRVLDWRKPHEYGAIQVGPGLMVVMHRGGVIAYTSPEALLEYLGRADGNAEAIAAVLPFLEGAQIRDRSLAGRLGSVALDCARGLANNELSERLQLVAARARLHGGQVEPAAKLLEPLLGSQDPGRRVRAAVALVDALERDRPASPLLSRALSLLEAEGPERVVRSDETRERTEVLLARAHWLRADAGRDFEAQRAALVRMLRIGETGGAVEQGLPLLTWARRKQEELLREPRRAAAHERDAELAVRNQQVDAGLVRAYAGTSAVGHWLRSQLRRPDLERGEIVRLAAWLRDYADDPDEIAGRATLDADLLLGAPQRPPRPADLAPVGDFQLGDKQLLAVHADGDAALLLLHDADSSSLELVRLGADGSEPLWSRRIPGLDEQRLFLEERALLTAEAATLVLRDRWYRIDRAGTLETIELPGACDHPHRLGRMAAALCRTPESAWALQVRDLDSGALFLEHELPPGQAAVDLVVAGASL
ncbi:MAG TPA: PQQ-binding-like beta-propeller repeat protein, partial [Planctomycetota bacterium]